MRENGKFRNFRSTLTEMFKDRKLCHYSVVFRPIAGSVGHFWQSTVIKDNRRKSEYYNFIWVSSESKRSM